jgi:hypothetical protein
MTIDEQLTPLGFHLAALPVDVRIGKMIVPPARAPSYRPHAHTQPRTHSPPTLRLHCSQPSCACPAVPFRLVRPCVGAQVLAAVFRCVGDVLTIAASLSSRSPFITPIDKREQADKVAPARPGAGPQASSTTLSVSLGQALGCMLRRR